MSATLYIGGDPDKVDVSGYVKGDILAANAAGTLTAFPIGANTEVLTVDPADPESIDWQPSGGIGNVNGVTFNSIAAPAYTNGLLFYDAAPEANTLTFYNSESEIETHLGRELLVPVRNTTGVTITPGQALRVTGNHPGTALPTVGLAQANTLAGSACIGIAAHSIENNTTGYVYMVGLAHHNIDTSTFANGDVLYLSAATPGALTATPPTDPNYRVVVGIVTRASAGNGAIAVSVIRTPTIATSVVAETLFSQNTVVGTSAAYSPADHSHGTPTILTAGTGFITSGNLSVGTAAFLALGSQVSVTAATGDVLELFIDSLLCDTAGGDLQLDAATRVTGADTNWWSTGTNASRFPGGLGSWYVQAGRFDSPHAAARYTVQAGDVSGGAVAVQLYGRASGSARTVFANATYPLRWWVVNLGPAS